MRENAGFQLISHGANVGLKSISVAARFKTEETIPNIHVAIYKYTLQCICNISNLFSLQEDEARGVEHFSNMAASSK